MTKEMLHSAYDLNSPEATRSFYDAWAETYDQEITQNGYATPSRCAAALAEATTDFSAPVLDIGCGTGISGIALKEVGFRYIHGSDFSAEMLSRAADKSVYDQLHTTDLNDPFPFETGAYSAISAMGVLNPGHAPAETLDAVLSLLNPDGLFVFSLNDHALADNTYEARLSDHVDSGAAQLLSKEYGPHLPEIDLKSVVYLLRKS